MRNFTLLMLFLLPFSLSAVTKTSVSNGSWSNPAIWSPVGVPGPGDDIFINHAVTYAQNINLGSPVMSISSSGSLLDMGTDTLTFGGDLFLISGPLTASVLIVGATDTVSNYSTIEVSELIQSGFFYNQSTGIICVSSQLSTSDYFYNYGSVSTGIWINSGSAAGFAPAKMCIASSFINTSQVWGTMDVCDASPGGMGDINTGTIAGTVTMCQAGPCAQCTLTSISESDRAIVTTITPHPVISTATIQFDPELINANSENQLLITDATGRVVKAVNFIGNTVTIDRENFESGLYFYTVTFGDGNSAAGKFLVE